MAMNDQQVERYARHILLPEIGGAGQSKILGARVLVVGAGGLGAPVIQYLAAAGIGTIGIIDDDVVDLSNLQRQVIHATSRIGMPKVDSAARTVAALNPDIEVITRNERLTPDNVEALISGYDVVADGSDNFETRFLVNDACFLLEKTLISAAILRFDGQLSTFKAHLEGEDHPCYRCVFPEAPPPGMVPACAEAGVLGALCGALGSLQATEVLKEITGAGESMSGSLLIVDGLSATFRKVRVKRDPGCALCGTDPTYTDLSHHGEPVAAA